MRIGTGRIGSERILERQLSIEPCFEVRTFHGHLEFMESVGDPATGEPIGTTEQNLKAAIAGETHEYTDMYPGMAKQARSEGFAEIADWFETLAKAERSHANRFQKALDQLAD